jgi:hypothetical protein
MERIRVSTQQLGDRHYLILIAPNVAILTQTLLRAGKGGRKARVKAAYFGFSSFSQAQQFAAQQRSKYPDARMQIRKAERLETAFEVKFSHASAEELAWQVSRQKTAVSEHLTRFDLAPLLSRNVGRKTITGRAGVCVGIE